MFPSLSVVPTWNTSLVKHIQVDEAMGSEVTK